MEPEGRAEPRAESLAAVAALRVALPLVQSREGADQVREKTAFDKGQLSYAGAGKEELQAYLSEITGYPEREYFRPNLFVNTPDILPFHLQSGEPWIFKARVALAATLSGNYGIYNGFELLEHEPIPGREEYLNSEKYELQVRD